MNPIITYFNGEKLQCSIGIFISLVCIATGLYFLVQVKTPLCRGVAWPFIIVSILLLTICIGIVVRSPKDIARVTLLLNDQPAKIATTELPRMEKVMKTFRLIKIIELCLILATLCAFLLFKNYPFLRGIVFGLFIQAMILYGFDHLAESRGRIYLDFLRSLA